MSILEENCQRPVLIFGGSSGIGLALAERVASRGSTPIIISRNEPSISSFHYVHFKFDLSSSYENLPALVSEIFFKYRFCSLCYSSSSSFPRQCVCNYDHEDFYDGIGVSTIALHYVLKSLCTLGGRPFRVVVLSSKSSDEISPHSGMMYSISKSSQKTLCRYYAEMYLDENIGTINLVTPDLVNTPMAARILADNMSNYIFQSPKNVAKLIDYLLDPDCPISSEDIRLNTRGVSF